MTRHPVTLFVHGEVYAVDDSGMVLLIGDTLWPMVWPASRRLPRPEVGTWARCMLVPQGGRQPVYTEDHAPTVEVWTPARIPAEHKALGGVKG